MSQGDWRRILSVSRPLAYILAMFIALGAIMGIIRLFV